MKQLLFLLAGLIIYSSSQAQFTPDSTLNTLVADSANVEETTPLMATTKNGYTYISWFKSNAITNQYDLYMQLLDSIGMPVWEAGGKLISSQPNSQTIFRYDLKTDNLGNAIVAFQDLRQGSNYTVAVYKLNLAGNHLFGATGRVFFDSLATSNMSPAIGVNRSNQTIIAWNCSDANNKWIAFQKLNPTGGALYLGPKRIRDASGAKKFSRPNIVPASDTSGFLIQYVMEIGNFPGATSTMNVQRYDDFGIGVWNSPKVVSSYTIPYFFFPQILSDKKGGFYIAFNGPNPSSPAQTEVYLQHVDSSGILWSTTGVRAINAQNEMHFYFDGCLTRTNSGLVLAVQTTDLSQVNAGISFQAFDLQGNIQYGPTGLVVLPPSSSIHQPFGLDYTGINLLLCYKSGGFGANILRAAGVATNGAITWDKALCSVNSNKDDYAAGDVVDGQLVTAWKDDRIGAGVYAQNISTYGTSGVLTSTNEPVFLKNVRLFPNPGNASEVILPSVKGETQWTLFDAVGREVTNGQFLGNKLILPLIEQKGVYFIQLKNNTESIILRWVVQ
jgi:hypothetical protein